jgi:glycosyltransferase involved in cell wall biosynthesis
MTGVERYAYSICKALIELGQPYILVCPKAPVLPCYDTTGIQIVHYGFGNSHLWEQCVLPFFFIGKKDYLVFSFTGLGSILIRNKVMTIHDLSFLENPKWFSKGYYWWYRLMTPLAVRTSRHIVTVSEFSKKEILRFYSFVKEQNISIVYNAADETVFYPLPQMPPPEKPFALAVSSLDPRKNFARLIEAFKDIKTCSLYIVGSYNHVFTLQENTKASQANIHFLGRISDKKLVQLYNQATCFIFPSIYEGFGLPPIEAMNCGCPVLASDIQVLREVCGEAALYFNPHNAKDIHDTIIQYFSSKDVLRKTMQAKGYTNASRFSWKKSALGILNIIKRHIANE